MILITCCVSFLLAFTVVVPGNSLQRKGVVTTQGTIKSAERPSIPNKFQVEVEGIFKDRNTGADGTIYFDRPNNIAAMDMLWQNDFVREIYSFDTNEIISIKGYSCEVKKIPDEPGESFFPFAVDPESKRKMLGPPEEALYFSNSAYVEDSYDGTMLSSMYQGYIDLPVYRKKNCSIFHHFSKPDFETARCESRFCNPILLSISVNCPGEAAEIDGETQIVGNVDHIYLFFNFMDTIRDHSVFHPPSGVYCNRENSKTFPILPLYFSFSYDITENLVQIKEPGGLKTLHKKIWYDGYLDMIRLDAFDDDGFVKDIRIFDFHDEMGYSSFLQVNEISRVPLNPGLSLNLLTLLPREVFPRTFKEKLSSPIFVGLRTVHSLEYHVWSSMTQDTDMGTEVVTELYFQTIVSEGNGEIVKEAGLQLSFIEIYTYMIDEDTDNNELSEVTFIPINNFRSASRDLSAFDLSPWFDKDEKRAFEINVTGPALISGTKSYNDFLEQIYLEIVTLASVSIRRISKLEMSYSDPASNGTTFTGWILEYLPNLGYGKQTNESDLNTAFSVLERVLREEDVEFTVTDKSGMEQTFMLSSFRQAETENKVNKDDSNDKNESGYSGGALAGVAVITLILGLVAGIIGVMVVKKRYTQGLQNNNKEPTSSVNKLFGLNSFSGIS